MIEVTRKPGDDPLVFDVGVGDGETTTRFRVTVGRAAFEGLTAGACTPEACIEATFRFLLDREPMEAILRQFDLSLIPHYFPEFPQELQHYFFSE